MSLQHNKRQKYISTTMSTVLLLGSRLTGMLEGINESPILSTLPTVLNNDVPLIGTHDGSFHCDEALAVSMLRLLPSYKSSPIIRTRNPDILAKCNIVVDVGAVYDPERHLYDHHQREFTDKLENYNTKLSSAGLVYKHFGKEILKEIISSDDGIIPSDEFVNTCYHKLYKDFMEHIDAIDNGISISDSTPRYHISSTLSSRVGMLNPSWNEVQTPDIINERFSNAMQLTCSEFLLHAHQLVKSWWPARSIVQSALDSRLSIHPSGKIIVLDQACPWKDHLFELESEYKAEPVLYALYQDLGGSWRIQAVPVDPNSFQSRKKLPDEWCGLRDDVLSEKVGMPGAIFIHASGFIGGHKDKAGALHIAIAALSK